MHVQVHLNCCRAATIIDAMIRCGSRQCGRSALVLCGTGAWRAVAPPRLAIADETCAVSKTRRVYGTRPQSRKRVIFRKCHNTAGFLGNRPQCKAVVLRGLLDHNTIRGGHLAMAFTQALTGGVRVAAIRRRLCQLDRIQRGRALTARVRR